MLRAINALIYGLLGLTFLILTGAVLMIKYPWAGGGWVILAFFNFYLAGLNKIPSLCQPGLSGLNSGRNSSGGGARPHQL